MSRPASPRHRRRAPVLVLAWLAVQGCGLVLDPARELPADAATTRDAYHRDAQPRTDAPLDGDPPTPDAPVDPPADSDVDGGLDVPVTTSPDARVDGARPFDVRADDVNRPDVNLSDANRSDAPDDSASSCTDAGSYVCPIGSYHTCDALISAVDDALHAAAEAPCCSDDDCILAPSDNLCCDSTSVISRGPAADCVAARRRVGTTAGEPCPQSCPAIACVVPERPHCVSHRCTS